MRVLVVETDNSASKSLLLGLGRHGHEVRSVDSGHAALLEYEHMEMIILALELLDLDGVEVCRRIRATSEVPIIALTARADEMDRVLALQAGADDCMVKPYGHRELLARMASVLRRSHSRATGLHQISHGPLIIDPLSRQVRLCDQAVTVTRKEFDLLHTLASQPEAVVSRKQLMAQVWEDDWAASDRTIDTHVSTLRSKLGDPGWIVTVRGVGYRIGRGAGNSLRSDFR